MSNDLPVPPELQHLIEKREVEQRGTSNRRGGGDRRKSDQGPIGAIESVEDLDQLPLEDRRSGGERRQGDERRLGARRTADADGNAADPPEGQ